MLELRRLRLLKELNDRGTIAAVADALQFTPSAVSQQLALLERETGVRLLERSGRGVRLTDPALVLVEHAEALLERAARAEADLAAASGTVGGRVRIATFQSVALRIVLPAMEALAETAPSLRCELFEAEPEQALPLLATGDVDLAIGDEWQHQPWRLPPGLERHELLRDPVHLALPEAHPATRHTEVPARRARGRRLDDRPQRDGVGGDDPAHVPALRRLRARHPQPHQRRHGQPRARRPRPRGDARARPRAPRRVPGRRAARDRRRHGRARHHRRHRSADATRPSVHAVLDRLRQETV